MSNKSYDAFMVIWVALCENVSSDISGQRRPRSACGFAQSDQGLQCTLTKLLGTREFMNGELRSG